MKYRKLEGDDFKGSLGTGRHFPAKVWGKPFWQTLHFASLVYRPAQEKAWKSMLTQWLPCAMPCERCRSHYINTINGISNAGWRRILKNRNSLVAFLFNLHNYINARVKGNNFKGYGLAHFLREYEDKRKG